MLFLCHVHHGPRDRTLNGCASGFICAIVRKARDQLSEVFDLVEVRGLVSGGFAARGDWVARFAIQYPLKLAAVVCGRIRLTADGLDRPIDLEPGDVAILNSRSWMVLEGGPGDEEPRELVVREGDPFVRFDGADCASNSSDVVIGGHVDLNEAGRGAARAGPSAGRPRTCGGGAPDCAAASTD